MPCFFRPCAIRSTASPAAAKCCAKNSTPWPAPPRARCSPGTAAQTRPTPRKFSPAARIICRGAACCAPTGKFNLDAPMPARYWIRLAELTFAFLLAIAVYFSWRADRRDRAQLNAELAATKQLLATADARQHDRDSQLAQTLAALAAEKR